MGNSATPGAPAITHAGVFDATAAKELQDTLANGVQVVLTGSADPLPMSGVICLNTAGVDATTLATPKAGPQPVGDDGKTIFIYDNTGNAHTITTATNKIINSKHLLTFGGTLGSNAWLIALNGVWVPAGLTGVTITS
jgi:hypothetical protein